MLKIAIVAGGATLEREISLRSARRVATTLKQNGHEVDVFDLDSRVLENLASYRPDVVWPLVHGSVGEDGSLQDLLEISSYAFVGTGAQGCRLASTKPVAKSVVAKNGLRTPVSVALPTKLFRLLGARQILEQVESYIGLPVVVKPSYGGSGYGISIVESVEQLPEAMADAFAYCDEVLIEKMVVGKEISVSIVDIDGEVKALPPVEVEVECGRYDYEARYTAGEASFFTPARLSEEVTEQVKAFALDCHRVLEADQFSRIDLIVTEQGEPWFIDANVIPGMTDTSLFPLACENGPGFAAVCEALVQDAASTKDADN